MGTHTFNIHSLSPYLAGLGIIGTIVLLATFGLVMWRYRSSPFRSFRWHLRSWRLKQLGAVSCLFYLAMAASSWVIQEPWGWLYLLVAFRIGTWWLHRVVIQRGI